MRFISGRKRCPKCEEKRLEELKKKLAEKKKCDDCGEEYEEVVWPKLPSPYIPAPKIGFPVEPIPMHDPNCQISIAQNGWWSIIPPRCTCGLFSYPTPSQTRTTTNTNMEE